MLLMLGPYLFPKLVPSFFREGSGSSVVVCQHPVSPNVHLINIGE